MQLTAVQPVLALLEDKVTLWQFPANPGGLAGM